MYCTLLLPPTVLLVFGSYTVVGVGRKVGPGVGDELGLHEGGLVAILTVRLLGATIDKDSDFRGRAFL
jgi:hypothetical protein